MQTIKIIPVKQEQISILLDMIKELAEFEKMLDEVTCDEKQLIKSFFEEKYATPLFITYNDEIVGYMIYYFTFSSFLGNGGVHLEDLYINPKYRDKGCGKKAFSYLINICKEKNLQRIEWVCLKDNYKAIDFYEKKLQAKDVGKIWHLYRLSQNEIQSLKI